MNFRKASRFIGLAVLIITGVWGCGHMQPAGDDGLLGRMAIKVRMSGKILATTAHVQINQQSGIEMVLLDGFGGTRGTVVIGEKDFEIVLLDKHCRETISNWPGKLAFASGDRIELGDVLQWFEPRSECDSVVTYQIRRNTDFAFDVSCFPPGVRGRAGIVINFVNRDDSIELMWIEPPVPDKTCLNLSRDVTITESCGGLSQWLGGKLW